MFGDFGSPNIEQSNNDIDIVRQKLSDEVKLNLEKYQSQIIKFNFGTVTNHRGDIDYLNNAPAIKYDDRFKDRFKTYNLNERSGKINGNGYIYINHCVSFEAYLGSDFRLGDFRNGNRFFLTIYFDKNGNLENENAVIDSIMKLLETISPYEINVKSKVPIEEQKNVNMQSIAKEGLPVLLALQAVGQKHETGILKMQNVINEYIEKIKQ